jgi:TonB-linked SusC/RagA family outer membrane protein
MKRLFSCFNLRLIPLFAVLFFFHSTASAQSVTVTGTVTDSLGAPVQNVSVKVKGAKGGTATNAEGTFSLPVPSASSTLVFSSVGYGIQEKLASDGPFNIVLSAVNETLTDVVIVGYTQQSQTKTTAAISKLNISELQNRPSPNPVQALQGKIAGVAVPVNSGQPGAGATNIIIRGGTKLNVYGSGLGNASGNPIGSADNTGPLVVIDGVFRSMDDINPDNIETFQVMKDAASTAIYGARGANGVIVIRTKGGKFNTKMNLTLNHRSTWETQSRDYHYLSATEYLRLARTTVKNTFDLLDKNNLLYNGGYSAGTRPFTAKGQFGRYVYTTALYDNLVAIEGQAYVDNLVSKGYQTMDDPINPGTKLIYADNGYQDKLWQTGLSQNNSIAINGGGENANYNLSTAYTDQKGVFAGTRYKRLDVLGNFGFKVAKNARIDAMINYQDVRPNYVEAFQNDLTRATRVTPLIRIYKDDGNAAIGENYTTRNRFHVLQYDDQEIATERLVARVGGDILLVKGLHFKPSVSYIMQDYTYMFRRMGTPADEIQPATIRQKIERTTASRQLMTDQVLQYDFNIGNEHNFTVLGGFNYTVNRANDITVGSQRASNDYIFTINEPATTVINGITVSNVTDFGTRLSESKSASVFGQVNYDYAGKYLLSASLRNDGFSNFAPENKYALFPSASVGWNMHMENWFSVKPVSMLKLRASWGEAGLSDLSLTDTYGGYSATSYALGSGILRANLSNPNLVWESTATSDLAFDAGFLNNRITLTVDVYNKLTKNRLASKPLPSEAPFPSIIYNNGQLQNRGIEIDLGGTVIKGKNFTWRTSVAFAKNNQKVIQLPDNGRANNRQGGDIIYDKGTKTNIEVGGIAEGERPFAMYAYNVLGVFATEADAAAWNAKTKDNLASPQGIIAKKHAGDFIFEDVNGDGIIDTKDQVFMGYRSPDITGGWQNTFSYKNISLRVGLDYALGHVISNGALARSLGQGRAFNEGAPEEALGPDIWQKEGDVGKKYARFSFADFDFGQRNYLRSSTLGNNNSYGSDVSALIEKGDFVALREITLTYELPASIMKKIHSTGLTVFASVFNVAYITKYSGINPETYSGFDAIGYPRPRQFTLGGTLRF